MTCYDILPPEQLDLLPHLQPLKALGYTLYGGTAIALQLGHRQSIDFDFFSDRPFDVDAIRSASPVLATAQTTQSAPRTLTLLARANDRATGVKLSFFAGFRFGRVGTPTLTSGNELRLASLDDLLGHKLRVLMHRAQAKDYQDIAAMLRAGLRLERGLGVARALGQTFAPAEALRALAYFEDGDLNHVNAADRQLLLRTSSQVGEVEPVEIASTSLS